MGPLEIDGLIQEIDLKLHKLESKEAEAGTADALIKELKQMLKKENASLESLRIQMEEEDSPKIRKEFSEKVYSLEKSYEDHFKRLNTICLLPKFRQNEASQRSMLLSNILDAKDKISSKDLYGKARAIDDSKDLTESLRRMKRHIIHELKRLDNAESLLQQDESRIKETIGKIDEYSSDTQTASKTLKSIEYKQQREYFLGRIGLVIFCITILYILFKRIPPSIYQIPVSINTILPLLMRLDKGSIFSRTKTIFKETGRDEL